MWIGMIDLIFQPLNDYSEFFDTLFVEYNAGPKMSTYGPAGKLLITSAAMQCKVPYASRETPNEYPIRDTKHAENPAASNPLSGSVFAYDIHWIRNISVQFDHHEKQKEATDNANKHKQVWSPRRLEWQ